jgi:ATP-dependent Clp protease ATP-binding subunit ClpC
MFERYTEKARRSLFLARYEASQCGSPQIEPEHLLIGILREDAPLSRRLSISEANLETIRTRLRANLAGKKILSTSVDMPLSKDTKKVLEYAAAEADNLKHSHVGADHLLLGIALDQSSGAAAILHEYGLSLERLREVAIERASEPAAPTPKAVEASAGPFRDLLAEAEKGEQTPLVGREREMERILRVLSRRTRNNVALIGEAGIGKTALVEGLAHRMVQAEVPAFLADRRLLAMDANSLLLPSIRAIVRGAHESVIDSLSHPSSTILFIRGLFNLPVAGSAWTIVEAMRSLEPQLATNGLHCIATGSPAGFRASIEKAGTLTRLFEVIPVVPVNEEDAVRIVSVLKHKFEQFHEVTISDGAIETAVYASGPFLPGRHLPDRAIDLIDEACVAVKLRHEPEPPEMVAVRKRIRQHLRAVEKAIEQHEFAAARRYSDEEKKERDNLAALRAQSQPDTLQRGLVTSEDVVAAVAARARVSAEAVERVLQTARNSEFQRIVNELAAMPSVKALDWLPLLASYLVRCPAAEAEALAKAILSAKAKAQE